MLPKITIGSFMGEAPRLEPSVLSNSHAQVALDCDIDSRGIRSYRNDLYKEDLYKTGSVIKSLYRMGSTWLHWTQDVDVARGPIAGDTTDRIYFTGTDLPRATDNTLAIAGPDYPTDSYQLGIPAPTAAPVATLGAGGSGTARDLSYVYTYVSGWGEEGPPSPPSNSVSALPGQIVTVNGYSAVPAGDYNITKMRLYRVVAGSASAEYRFVTEFVITTTTYDDSDDDTVVAANEALQSTYWVAPPSDMKNIIALPNGVMAGVSGNQLCLSEPGLPHAWPVSYRKTFDEDIVGIGAYGTTIVVCTNSYPYIVYGNDPAAMSERIIKTKYPCLSKRGIVSTNSGVIFPTPLGLFRVGQSGHGLITRGAVEKDDWMGFYNPASFHAYEYEGKYLAFYSNAVIDGVIYNRCLIFDPSEPESGFIFVDQFYDGGYVDDAGDLYVAKDDGGINKIYKWAGAVTKRSYTWKSKKFLIGDEQAYTYARVKADFSGYLSAEDQAALAAEQASTISANAALISGGDIYGEVNGDPVNELANNDSNLAELPAAGSNVGVTLKLYADGVEVAARKAEDAKPFRLPGGYRGDVFEIQLEGDLPIEMAEIATSMRELS